MYMLQENCLDFSTGPVDLAARARFMSQSAHVVECVVTAKYYPKKFYTRKNFYMKIKDFSRNFCELFRIFQVL